MPSVRPLESEAGGGGGPQGAGGGESLPRMRGREQPQAQEPSQRQESGQQVIMYVDCHLNRRNMKDGFIFSVKTITVVV